MLSVANCRRLRLPFSEISTLAIVGTGLIGSSIGLRARALGIRVIGSDRSVTHVHEAQRLGAIDDIAENMQFACCNADMLVIATPLETALVQLRELCEKRDAGLMRTWPRVIVDVASVKGPIVEAARTLPGFVATHPIAGSERSGPGAARADLFEGRVWTYVPPFDPGLTGFVHGFIESMGSTPLAMDALQHDRLIALTSHLPQVLAVALGTHLRPALANQATRLLCGTGMESMTRLGGSSWEMWRGIFANNAQPIAQEVRSLAELLLTMADDIEAQDDAGLAACFSEAFAAVRNLQTIQVGET